MPCDSAGAGLVTLGALIRDLGNPNAHDTGNHYNSLLRFARQYLDDCRTCGMRCQPALQKCGYTAQATGWVRHKGKKLYQISEISEKYNKDEQVIVCSAPSLTRLIVRQTSPEWQIDGAPTPQIDREQKGVIPEEPYDQIIANAQIIADNLRRSFSGLCLAGRVAGEIASREACASIRFRTGEREYRLSEMLTVHEWSADNNISRTTFFNSRTGRLNRASSAPTLVVADGAECFLKVLTVFDRSDVIGIVHRTIERDCLEEVGNRVIGLRQWYVDDPEVLAPLPNAPTGISVLSLRRRNR
jgi:hypothetical protein